MKLVEISSIEEFDYVGDVFDLNIDEDHSYNVYGIVVHNSDFVMLGSMLAGHDQGGGEIITKYYETNEWDVRERTLDDGQVEKSYLAKKIEEKKFIQFYGMSSKTANEKHFGGLKEYRSSEGRTVLVPYKGDVRDTIQHILGGVRSACTYCGARRLKDLPKCATFSRCNRTHNTMYESNTIGY